MLLLQFEKKATKKRIFATSLYLGKWEKKSRLMIYDKYSFGFQNIFVLLRFFSITSNKHVVRLECTYFSTASSLFCYSAAINILYKLYSCDWISFKKEIDLS